MGHRVNPVGLRLNLSRRWSARWYAQGKVQFATYIRQDSQIRDYFARIERELQIERVLIQRTNNSLNISIYTARPGLLIGKKGQGASKHIANLSRLLNYQYIYIEAKEIAKPYLYASYVANQITSQLEKRISFSYIMQKAASNVMQAGALGVKIILSGRLNGAEIARSESVIQGKVALSVFRNMIDYSCKKAHTLFGIIGVKVYINRPPYRSQSDKEVSSQNKRS